MIKALPTPVAWDRLVPGTLNQLYGPAKVICIADRGERALYLRHWHAANTSDGPNRDAHAYMWAAAACSNLRLTPLQTSERNSRGRSSDHWTR